MIKKFDKEHLGNLVTDARGRKVKQLDPFALRLMRRFDVMPREDLEAIAREIGSGLEKGPRVLLIIGLICLGIGLIATGVKVVEMLLAGTFNVFELFRGMTPLMGTVSGPLVLWFGACRVRSRKTLRIMLAHRRCPHCGYDLRGLAVDERDGATVCPECGCAWKV